MKKHKKAFFRAVTAVVLSGAVAFTSLAASAAAPMQEPSAEAAGQAEIIDEEQESLLSQNNSSQQREALNRSSVYLTIHYDNLTPQEQLYLTQGDRWSYVVRWYSSNPAVAAVSGNGCVTAFSPGTATITARTSSGNALSCKVYVSSDVGTVALAPERVLFPQVGGATKLAARVRAEGGDRVPFTFVSSNPSVAVVDDSGLVTAVGDGEATITAISPEGRSAVCYVYVGTAAEKYEKEDELMTAVVIAGIVVIGIIVVVAAASS